MADIGFTVGFLTMCGFVDEDTYGVEKRVTEPLVIISESISPDVPLLQQPALDARPQRRQGLPGNLTIAGDIVIPLRYGLGHPLFRNYFGSYNALTKTFTHQATTASQSFTFAIRKGATVWAFMGGKITQLTIAATPDGVTVTAACYFTNYTAASGINTLPVIARLVDPSADVLYRHFREVDGQSSIWVGDQEDALTVLNKIAPGSLTITLGRPLDQVQTNEGLAEPAENDYPPITIAATLPHHSSNQYEGWKERKDQLAARIRFVSPETGEFKLMTFPNVQAADGTVNIGGPGAAEQPMNFTASEAERTLTSTAISAAASDNSLNITSVAGVAATGTLTLTGVVADGETVTIGARVYEIDFEEFPGTVGDGRVRVDMEATSVKASQTLTVDVQPIAADTMTIGATVYTFVAIVDFNVAGEISVGTNLATAQAAIVSAVNGTDGVNTAHPTARASTFTANVSTITAKAGGTAGNAIATTETFTAVTNIFGGATLAAGTSPTAPQAITALVLAITGDEEAEVSAVDSTGDTIVVTAENVGTLGNTIVTTDTLTNGAWGAVTLVTGTNPQRMPYAVPGAAIWLEDFTAGAGQNLGVAVVISRTDAKIVISNAAAGGITLVDETAGASVTITTRSPDILMLEGVA